MVVSLGELECILSGIYELGFHNLGIVNLDACEAYRETTLILSSGSKKTRTEVPYGVGVNKKTPSYGVQKGLIEVLQIHLSLP
jgi:hypothetical protein